MSVCFPLSNGDHLCRRKQIVDNLKNLVKEVECDPKSPICRLEKEAQSNNQRCYCATPSDLYHEHVMMDGKPAKPVVPEDRKVETVKRKKWCPPCLPIRPMMDPIHNCYKTDKVRGVQEEKVEARNGLPPDNKGEVCGNGPETGSPQEVDTIGDDVFGGQSCSYKHPAPTKKNYYCPEGDPFHVHWSPPYTQKCRYPNTCVASCFHPPAVNDWIYQQPRYRSYLQNLNDKPFKKGF